MKIVDGILYGLYKARLRREIDEHLAPKHVAVIVDGNRRWAKQRMQERAMGHRAGAKKIPEFLGWCKQYGVQVVTLYLLSSDNLNNRPDEELEDLFEIIGTLACDLAKHRDWRIQHVGEKGRLPKNLLHNLELAEEESKDHKGLHINLAVGYGGRHEITQAVQKVIEMHKNSGGTLDSLAETLTPEIIGECLWTSGQPDPDLVIRTSGEQRLSDFMIWQSAHSEFYFVEALYPDLREVDFLRALRDFSKRHRRFGS